MTPSPKRVLVINAGSSSVKFSLFDMAQETPLTRGIVERIGLDKPSLNCSTQTGAVSQQQVAVKDHRDALRVIARHVSKPDFTPSSGGQTVDAVNHRVVDAVGHCVLHAVGHRVVHGGEKFSQPVLIDDEVKQAIQDFFPLAPLHNPVSYRGIEACQELFPGVPHVAVFDTAFHQTLPPEAYTYAIPIEFYQRHRIRRYGFHGTSHRYVALEASKILKKPLGELNLITCHLGNGCSVTAVKSGKSVDTSLGFTPLEGLVMGTRSGDIDPAIIFFLARHEHMSIDELDELLNRKSGLLALSGNTSDMRGILDAASSGDSRAQLAVDVFVHRIRKYVGAFAATLGRLDALVFTAGIGENSGTIREKVCKDLAILGITLDGDRNRANETFISSDSSPVKVLVIPTNEEVMIARDTLSVIENS